MAALIQFANGAPGIKYTLDRQMFTIGRSTDDNDVCVPCAFVSKRHAQIEIFVNLLGDGYDYYLQDLDSTNLTYVNDHPINRVKLEDGDIIRIGKTTFKFDGTSNSNPHFLTPLHVEISEPAAAAQSNTFNFSRRLRVLGVDA